ncbi:MAG: hypothetical protein VW270_22435, partial [Candidatus Poseidoniales archaeon]
MPSSSPTVIPTSTPSSEPTSQPTSLPTASPTRSMNVQVTFASSQTISSSSLNTSALLTPASLEYQSFVGALSDVTGVPSADITITSVTSVSGYHRSPSRRLEDVQVQYEITTNSNDMGLTSASDPSSGQDLFDHIKNSLSVSTQASSGGSSLFDTALKGQAISVAISMGLNTTEVSQTFSDISSSHANVDDNSFTEVLLRTRFPTSVPTSMPSCGVGSQYIDGSSGSNCEPCSPGTHRNLDHVHSNAQCVPCNIDEYSDVAGAAECKKCPLLKGTFGKGSPDCDATSLRGSSNIQESVFTVIAAIAAASIGMAVNDRLATAVFSFFPALDFISDIVYVLEVGFVSPYLFYAAIVCLFLSGLMFVNELAKLESYPSFLIPFPGKYLFAKVRWLSHEGMSPLVEGQNVGFERHDNLPKVFAFIVLWLFLIGLQVIWFVMYILWIILHCVWWGPWLVFGLILYQLKSMCVKRVYNLWIYGWTLSTDHFKLDYEEYPTDAGMMNESLLNEFILESIPQLLLQGINNTYTDQWLTGVTLFSFVFSLTIVINSIWRFGYYRLV